jgi:D-tyrosyl-tRNA(Tyr) deacylase
MKAVIQRVSKAKVSITDDVREIKEGLVVLLGVAQEDTQDEAKRLADKTAGLRIFANDKGRFDLSVCNTGGEVLVVSQFTLYADSSRGKRPDFTRAAKPEKAKLLYEKFIDNLRQYGLTVKTGEFAAHMHVEIFNNGPVTIVLDTDEL